MSSLQVTSPKLNLTSKKILNRQQILYLLKIFPVEVIDFINSFCYYTIKDAKIINFIKNKKQEITNKFKYALYPINHYPDGTWAIWLNSKIDYLNNDATEIQLQSQNCIICGNYQHTETIYGEHIPQIIQCSCNGN